MPNIINNVAMKIRQGFSLVDDTNTLAPLISPEESELIKQYALQNIQQQTHNKELNTTLLGDLASRNIGSGSDFDQYRRYQTGDDSRLINWRVYARTEKLHVNIYHEDKQPSTYIVINRGASMRFGTRESLKVKQAARIANYHFYLCTLQHLPIGAVVIDDKIDWHAESNASASHTHLLNAINQSCPPTQDSEQISSEQTLSYINKNCQAGSNIILISDFIDTGNNYQSLLYQCAEKYNIIAYSVSDPIEHQLPKKGYFKIYAGINKPAININCNDASIKGHYKALMSKKTAELNQVFSSCGINCVNISTEDKLFNNE